ncbi:MAG TPA: hypothetical protein GXX19_00460 [Syntrophomonadaceae bacterium]|nr:hypothetical protein [Syntrophomonadaceae bacterium]
MSAGEPGDYGVTGGDWWSARDFGIYTSPGVKQQRTALIYPIPVSLPLMPLLT